MKALDFNEGWTFCKEGVTSPQQVTLPHDAMLFEGRKPDNPSGGACACFGGGVYRYEKIVHAPKEWQGCAVQLYFEGAYMKSTVLLNGKTVGGCTYGYSAFLVTLDGLRYGEENLITVIVENDKMPNSRWYTGSGIYRPVHLLIGKKEHIRWQGVKINTLSCSPAKIRVQTNHTGGDVEVEILYGKKAVAAAKGEDVEVQIPDAKLWSADTPNLYQCRVTLKDGGEIQDQVTEDFGIRMIEYSNKGLFINGKETLLKGGCVHHDNGILGAKTFAESEWRRVRILKESGYNAIRSSHNPCAIEMMKACDYYGIYIMDETWDMWYSHKNKYDYASDFMEGYRFDLKSMVEKDFNHPSVIMYSIGNEVSEPATKKGGKLTKEMVEYLHQMDQSRPVTGGFNLMIMAKAADGKGIYKEEGGRDNKTEKQMNSSMMFNVITSMVGSGMNKAGNSKKVDAVTSPALDTLDIAGYNYASGRYPLEAKCHPDRVIFGSETFPKEIAKNWKMVESYPYLIGDFMWTSWDYLGEAGSGAWGYTSDSVGFEKPYPWILAEMGALDILGNPNGQLFWAQAVWKALKAPVIAVQPVNHPGKRPAKSAWRGTNALPTWSWKGCTGNKAVVEVYYDAAKVDLFLDNRKVGSKAVKDCRAVFKMKYTPGTLKAVAYDAAGNVIGQNQLVSAKENLKVRILPEKEQASPGEILYISVQVTDEDGIVESNADRRLEAEVKGGELLGFGSANPRTEESYVQGAYTTHYGYAQAVVRAGNERDVTVIIHDGKEQYEKKIPVILDNGNE